MTTARKFLYRPAKTKWLLWKVVYYCPKDGMWRDLHPRLVFLRRYYAELTADLLREHHTTGVQIGALKCGKGRARAADIAIEREQ
jgi:hypothetical protein